ncbi:MAG: DUF4982 domain-containing protein [Lachnospiraceae bacterium]|nr:DUF4982 domain-containing protein [Lachnospiraceae bacterium]
MSYYREIVFGRRTFPYIAVQDPAHFGESVLKTSWTWDDDLSSWTWPGYEGKPILVAVYSSGAFAELFINGQSHGRKPAGEAVGYRTVFEIPYESGVLSAISYDHEGHVLGEYAIETAGAYRGLVIEEEPLQRGHDQDAFVVLNIRLTDEHERTVPFSEKTLYADVSGGAVSIGFGSGDPKPRFSCQGSKADTHYGQAQLILKKVSDAPVQVRIRDEEGHETVWTNETSL